MGNGGGEGGNQKQSRNENGGEDERNECMWWRQLYTHGHRQGPAQPRNNGAVHGNASSPSVFASFFPGGRRERGNREIGANFRFSTKGKAWKGGGGRARVGD